MIRRLKAAYPVFVLDTDNTTYLFAVTPSRHLEHLYYGGKIRIDKAEDCAHIRERHEFELGNCISYDKKFPQVMLEDMCLEMSGAGHGDIREPFVSLVYPDGSRSVDFLYEKSTLSNQKEPLQTLPCAYTENGKTEHLIVELRDGALVMELHYTVYPACDVITRSAVLLNEGYTYILGSTFHITHEGREIILLASLHRDTVEAVVLQTEASPALVVIKLLRALYMKTHIVGIVGMNGVLYTGLQESQRMTRADHLPRRTRSPTVAVSRTKLERAVLY